MSSSSQGQGRGYQGQGQGQGRGGYSRGGGGGGSLRGGRGTGTPAPKSQITFNPNQPASFPEKEWKNEEKRQRKVIQGQGPGQGVRGKEGAGARAISGREEGSSCIVCYKDVKYYSVGTCDHGVCFECSARMKVLLEQNECPICRTPVEQVVFTRSLCKYRELKDKLRMFIYLPKWGIYLEDEGVKDDFDRLLEHRCPFCPDQFDNFAELSTHANRKHQMFACDLCTENIKVFSLERQFYNRQDLATHKRKGDRHDTSHKGHPLCQFCDRRYFDNDELFKHLRKDHYFCHFCDADGLNHYYNTYDDLRIHFRKEHFLCEEENCKHEQFTTVFRTDIDMKAHLTQVHSRLLGKHGMKQARIIDVEFNVNADEERKSRRFNRDGFVGRGARRERGDPGPRPSVEEDMSQPYFEPTIHEKPKVDSVADFPMLDGAAAAMLPAATNGNTQTSASGSSSSIAQKVALSSGLNVGGLVGGQGPKWNARSRQDEEFPALGGPPNFYELEQAASTQRPFASAAVLKKPNSAPPKPRPPTNGVPPGLRPFQEDFPSLGNSSSSNGSAWVASGFKMKGNKSTPRSLKVAPAPLERKVEIDPFDSFNFVPLNATRARKDSLTKKYESIMAPEDEFPVMEKSEDDSKLKKKKKPKDKEKNDSAKSKALAAAALFNDGKGKSSKDKLLDKKLTPKEDFPSLEPIKKAIETIPETKSNPNLAGISLSGPPPGFNSIPRPSSSSDLFSAILTSPSKSNNNNNFEELELLARVGSAGKLYTQPPGFTRRNQQLMAAIRSSLNQDEGAFDMFKSVSNQYKKGELSSKEYYELCQDMFGMSDFRLIFPELLTLLPEIEKQQELLSAHRRAGGPVKDLTSCKECFQVVKIGDLTVHIQAHGESQLFPAL